MLPFLAYFACALALWGYGVIYPDPPLIFRVHSTLLLVSFAVLLAPWVRMVVNHRRKQQQLRWKSLYEMLVMLGLGLYLAYVGAFHGVARLLHAADNESGEVIATVSGKHPPSRRPRLCAHFNFEEFRFSADRICANGRLYKTVEVGDHVRITGRISRYGLDPYEVEPVSEDIE